MQCQFTKSDGEQCRAKSMAEATFCFSHNPESREDKHLAVVKGGLNSRNLELNLPTLDLKTPQQVIKLLEDTINRVREGGVPPNIANTVGYLAGHLLKAIEISNLDKRIEMVESILIERKLTVRR